MNNVINQQFAFKFRSKEEYDEILRRMQEKYGAKLNVDSVSFINDGIEEVMHFNDNKALLVINNKSVEQILAEIDERYPYMNEEIVDSKNLENFPYPLIDGNIQTNAVPVAKTSEEILNQAVLVHSTNFFPENGVIKTTNNAMLNNQTFLNNDKNNNSTLYIYNPNKNEIESRQGILEVADRQTVHFAVNGFVAPVGDIGNDWDNMPFVIMEPMNHHIDSSLVGGFIGDTYYIGDFKLSSDALLLVNEIYYLKHKKQIDAKLENFPGKIILFNGDKNKIVKEILEANNYPYFKALIDINSEYNFKYDNLEYKRFCDAIEGLEQYNVGMHFNSIERTKEESDRTKNTFIKKMYNSRINSNEEKKLTPSVFYAYIKQNAPYLIDKYFTFNEYISVITNYGFKYNKADNTYVSVGLDEFKQRNTLYSQLKFPSDDELASVFKDELDGFKVFSQIRASEIEYLNQQNVNREKHLQELQRRKEEITYNNAINEYLNTPFADIHDFNIDKVISFIRNNMLNYVLCEKVFFYENELYSGEDIPNSRFSKNIFRIVINNINQENGSTLRECCEKLFEQLNEFLGNYSEIQFNMEQMPYYGIINEQGRGSR